MTAKKILIFEGVSHIKNGFVVPENAVLILNSIGNEPTHQKSANYKRSGKKIDRTLPE